MPTQSKLASNETQERRGRAVGKVAVVWCFLVFTSIPILNIVFGMMLVLWFGKLIFARSAQLGKDFSWLFLGAYLDFITLFKVTCRKRRIVPYPL
jgi:hypothetical protein